jgi:hypothetical protein
MASPKENKKVDLPEQNPLNREPLTKALVDQYVSRSIYRVYPQLAISYHFEYNLHHHLTQSFNLTQ